MSARITAAGVYEMSAALYHADPMPTPSLSSSLARVLLTQSPRHAFAAHPRLNPDFAPDEEDKFDFGAAAHRLILGKGAELAVIDCPDWRTKAAREGRDAARAEGRIPIKAADFDRAMDMAKAFVEQIGDYPRPLREAFDKGRSEQVIAWQERGIWCRAMVDKLYIAGTTAVLIDLKSTLASADPYRTARRIFDIGYDIQARFYPRGLEAVRPEITEVRFFIITQESMPPFALSVAELGHAASQLADKKVLTALALWERCIAADDWPGYPPVITTVEPPAFMENAWLEREVGDPALAGVDSRPVRAAGAAEKRRG